MYAAQLRFNEFYVGSYMDDANYIILAESMVQGQGYRQINDPAAPLETRYPPGYPAVLAPIILLGRDNLDLLKLPSVIAAVLAVWLASKHYDNPKTGRRQTFLALVLFAFNPLIVGHSVAVMSEAVFLAVLLATALTLDHTAQATEFKDVKWSLSAASLAAACALIRTTGWLLLPAGALFLTSRHRWRQLLVFALAFAALMFPWTLRNSLVSGNLFSTAYEEQLAWESPVEHTAQPLTPGFLISRALGNLNAYVAHDLPETLMPGIGSPQIGRILSRWNLETVQPFLGCLFSAIIALGLVKQWRTRGFRSLDWFAVLYAGLLLIWPFVGGRFLHSLIPLLSLSLVYGLESATAGIPRFVSSAKVPVRLYAQRVALVFLALIVALYLFSDAQMIINPLAWRTTNLTAGTDYITQNAPEEAIVMAPHPMAWYVHLHRRTIAYPPSTASSQEAYAYIIRARTAYILISPPLAIPRPTTLEPHVADILLPLLKNRSERFQQVYEDPAKTVTIWKVLPP